MSGAPVLQMSGVSKTYNALRPLRIASLVITEGERVSLGGVDAGAGELLINLVTGASVPDKGDIRIFGRLTAEIADGDEWLTLLEQFGIVSPRAVMLEGSTLLQNLAMPFTLEIDPVPAEIVAKVRALAEECSIDPERWLSIAAGQLPADVRVLAHLARALALAPQLVVIEHPTVDVSPDSRSALAAAIARACQGRRLAALIVTNDDAFGKVVAPRNLTLDGATGQLKPLKKGWFS